MPTPQLRNCTSKSQRFPLKLPNFSSEKEKEEAEAAREVSTANTALQKAEDNANQLKSQIRAKKIEVTGTWRRLSST